MKVIILKETEGLGKIGDVKEVADGHARNFLIPEGIVKPATEGAEKEIEILKEAQAKKSEEELKLIVKKQASRQAELDAERKAH